MQTPYHRHGATAAPQSRSTSQPDTAHANTPAQPDTQPHPDNPAAASGSHGMSTTAVALPVAAALLYGLWTVFVDRTSGSSLGHAWLLGLITAIVSGVLGLLLVRIQSTLVTEVRALAYGTFFGVAIGYLYSISSPAGHTVLESVRMGLIMGAVMFAVSLYVFRTHRVREPHGEHRPRRAHRHPHPSN
ncbi:hypothetical protein CP973_04465 [Streptomyces albofaciens JCM 4342]|uniref:metal ABC transporter permease n=1 Tax=Streptomyces albofaciens TaxID=66866 RepID=UPI00123AACCA|nr:metal ABC transporter permease [Streptomyces albofaciens]KAA6221325.1 hypothetical protein CP973_04465 [Streptomyces albofaciens JCM 4342]